MCTPSTQESTAASSPYLDPDDMQQHGRVNVLQSTSTSPLHEHGEQTQYGQYPQVPTLASELVLTDGSLVNPYFNQHGDSAREKAQKSCPIYPNVLNEAIATGPPLRQSNFVITDSGLYRERSDTSVTEPDSVLGESGRWYHGYKEGKYLLPNDPVGIDALSGGASGLRARVCY